MTSRLVVRPQAEEELLGARDWYDGQRAGLGQAFVDDVREALEFFRATSNEVVVLAIIHGRRHPQRWKSNR